MTLAIAPGVEGTVLQHLAIVPDRAMEDRLIGRLSRPERPLVLSFVNAHACNMVGRDPGFAADLLASDVLLRDGCGVALALGLLGGSPGLNMNGTDLIPKLLAARRGAPVALLGTAEPWLGKAAGAIEAAGGRVALTLDGFLPVDAYLAAVAAERPALIVLGMGMPKQERVAMALKGELCRLGHPALIVNGGAIIDFMAGRVRRAPEAMRRYGAEWLYRLWQEPVRLFDRYVGGAAPFLCEVAKLRAKGLPAP